MVGLLRIANTKGRWPRRAVIAECQIAGVVFCEICLRLPKRGTLPAKERAVHHAARRMARLGIRRVVPPKEPFPYWGILGQYGILPVSSQLLLQNLAAPIALFALKTAGRSRRRETVAIQADRIQVEIERAARQLVRAVRNVALQMPNGEVLGEQLRTEYGVPALQGPAGAAQASVVLLFSDAPTGELTAPGEGMLFYFGESAPNLVTRRRLLRRAVLTWRNGTLPNGAWDQTALLAVLWEHGAIPLDQLEIVQLS